jgi:secreted Zn-dependent insulinase-like peptidase
LEKITPGFFIIWPAKGSIFFIKLIKDLKTLTLCWEIPSVFANNLDERFPEFLAYILNKEVKGSLLAKLKKENIAQNLNVYCHRLSKDQCVFFINDF